MKKLSTLVALLALVVFSKTQAQQTIYWSEGFEGVWTNNWYVDNGVWNVGLPTNPSGPDSTHGGIACAAVGLNTGSNNSASTRIININYITIPSANQNPRLRFWHWFNLGNVNGRVQIKTATGTWTNLTTYNYHYSCSDVWSVDEIDLTQWADSSIQLGFFFQAGGGNGWIGWFIDDLEIRTGQFYFNNPEGFENGYGDWSIEQGTWEIGTPLPSPGPGSAHSGNNCAAIPLAGYPDDNYTRLRSAWFVMPSVSLSPALTFWQWFNLGPGANPYVEIRTNNNLTWQQISTTFSGNSLGWSYYYLPLTSWADSTVQLSFHFSASGGNTYPGWWIDDININGYVGVSEFYNDISEIKLYPNPVSAIAKLNFENKIKEGTLTLFNSFGIKVYSTNINNLTYMELDLTKYSQGIYFLRIEGDNKIQCKKLIVEHN